MIPALLAMESVEVHVLLVVLELVLQMPVILVPLVELENILIQHLVVHVNCHIIIETNFFQLAELDVACVLT